MTPEQTAALAEVVAILRSEQHRHLEGDCPDCTKLLSSPHAARPGASEQPRFLAA